MCVQVVNMRVEERQGLHSDQLDSGGHQGRSVQPPRNEDIEEVHSVCMCTVVPHEWRSEDARGSSFTGIG